MTKLPTLAITATEFAANVPTPAIVNCVTLRASFSGSVSLGNTLPVAIASSRIVLVSGNGSGASFTTLTDKMTLAGADI